MTDVDDELIEIPLNPLAAALINDPTHPLNGYNKVPLVSLEEATTPLAQIVNKIEQMVWTVKQNCEYPEDGLTSDESAAIALYSMDWYPQECSFSYIINQNLRLQNNEQMKPWFLYLRLLFHALSKLPSSSNVVYQGMNGDHRTDYPDGMTYTSWEFLNCMRSIRALEDEENFNQTGERTLVTIECRSGKAIRQHAFDSSKDQVLLLPGRHFRVASCLNAGNQLIIVQLQEMETSYSFE